MNDLVTTDVSRAVACLQSGGLAALPTETVYGLGADADQPAAVHRVFAVKGRPADHPLIVHLAAADRLGEWAARVPSFAVELAATCWPGPLTLLLARSDRVSDVVTGGRPTVGIRVPAHPVACSVLEALDGGVAAPSANRFGRVSPTTARHVLDDLGPLLDPTRDVILDGGPSPVGVESTIVDCTVNPPQLLRPGGIPTAAIEVILGRAVGSARGPSRAAGMLDAHYAPTAAVVLVDDGAAGDEVAVRLVRAGRRPVVLRDRSGDLVAYARHLYADLREADDAGATDIIAVLPPAEGLGQAIRDRLLKASASASPAPASDER